MSFKQLARLDFASKRARVFSLKGPILAWEDFLHLLCNSLSVSYSFAPDWWYDHNLYEVQHGNVLDENRSPAVISVSLVVYYQNLINASLTISYFVDFYQLWITWLFKWNEKAYEHHLREYIRFSSQNRVLVRISCNW